MMLTFFQMFLLYLFLGLTVTAIFFAWAVKHDQFRDQRRARFIPLDGVEPLPAAALPKRRSRTIMLTIAVGAAGFVSLAGAAIVVALSG
jgi:nitrogen fixation-related uncharacterized protein